MKKISYTMILTLAAVLGCSSPAKVEVRPNPLVLEGAGAKGRLEATIFDENGKDITKDYSVTWMCLDTKTLKVQQDGTIEALSSGTALVDAEVVGTESHGLPGSGVHGTGTVEVKIPSWIEISEESLNLVQGQAGAAIWAEVRDDKGFAMKGYLPTWKVENPSIASVETSQDEAKSRAFAKITPISPGETYIAASYKNLAADILVTVEAKEPTVPVE